MSTETVPALADQGREVIQGRFLKTIRGQYGLSRSAQAHMIGVSPTALRNWEQGNSLSRSSAERIARWYQQVSLWIATVDDELALMVSNGELIHVTMASQQLAMSYGTITEKCRSGVLRCHDLGPFGLYVYSDQLDSVHAHRQA